MEASCCPIKYDCSFNSTVSVLHDEKLANHKALNVKRKNRSNGKKHKLIIQSNGLDSHHIFTGCFESEKYYQEGEKLPSDDRQPCEMCYCIKGIRKCVHKKCAPLIRGCIPQVPKEGNCCPTSYDCSRSLKVTRQIEQHEEDEPEEDNDSIDFFSLLFGSDDPPEEANTVKNNDVEATTLQPFKALPSTEKSFFDLIRAGLEIIDANADKIDSSINVIASTAKSIAPSETFETTSKSIITSTAKLKFVETTEYRTSLTQSSRQPETERTTMQSSTSSSQTTKASSPTLTTTIKKTPSTMPKKISRVVTTKIPGKRTDCDHERLSS